MPWELTYSRRTCKLNSWDPSASCLLPGACLQTGRQFSWRLKSNSTDQENVETQVPRIQYQPHVHGDAVSRTVRPFQTHAHANRSFCSHGYMQAYSLHSETFPTKQSRPKMKAGYNGVQCHAPLGIVRIGFETLWLWSRCNAGSRCRFYRPSNCTCRYQWVTSNLQDNEEHKTTAW
jgi:hypothetical protein